MKIIFAGTRGYITAKTQRHKRHTTTIIEYKGKRVAIDCGLDWLGAIEKLKPDAIVITHPHPDHAWGLKDGAPCPVYATPGMWRHMKFPIKKRIIRLRAPKVIYGIRFEAFPVIHSIKVPAVGYRITAGSARIFCVHDIISIRTPKAALSGTQLYIGDGATLKRPIIRRKGKKLFGHTTISAQLGWCQKYKVPRAIFTHCGSQIVEGDERTLSAQVRTMGKERGVKTTIAYDGLTVTL